jgi:predicted metal-dependent hydrolase
MSDGGGRPHAIDLGGRRLEFRLRRSERRQTLEISVAPDQKVTVTAPMTASAERIARAVRRRASWIMRQQRAYEDLPPPPSPRQWVAGETHRYLGRQYRLRLVQAARTSVRLSGAFFVVAVPRPGDQRLVRRAMERWYRDHAISLLGSRVSNALASTTWLRILKPPSVIVRTMRLRWGSATANGRVYFNVDLVKLPLGCIDYVVIHELVHLAIPNHGPTFWRLLSRCMPDWERWKMRLAMQTV